MLTLQELLNGLNEFSRGAQSQSRLNEVWVTIPFPDVSSSVWLSPSSKPDFKRGQTIVFNNIFKFNSHALHMDFLFEYTNKV